METALKDIGEIHGRLLDHKPIIHGEFKYFVKEFEGKRSNREMKRLRKIQEHTNDINDRVLPQCEDFMLTYMPNLQETMNVTIKMCDRIVAKEEQRMAEEPLKENQSRREKEWTSLTEKLSGDQADIDTQHQIRIHALEEQYSKMKILISKQ